MAGSTQYFYPFRGKVTPGRIDQGQDFSMAPGTPIVAYAKSFYIATYPNWFRGQPIMVFRVLDGPDKGKFWFLAEQITPSLHRPQTVQAGQEVARYASHGTAIEIGYAADAAGTTLARATTGYTEGQVTPAGKSFAARISGLRRGGSGVKGSTATEYTQRQVVNAAAKKYNVNPDVLWGIYGAESSWGKAKSWFGLTGDYPGVGTSGDFGKDANRSAQIMRQLLNRTGQSYEKALRLYSGGAYGMAHIRDLEHGGQSVANDPVSTDAPFGRTRPGGVSGTGSPTVQDVLASYAKDGGGGSFGDDPIGDVLGTVGDVGKGIVSIFTEGADAIAGVVDFLKWISWLFHPRNVLRAVEFVTGMVLMGFGLHSMFMVYRGTPSHSAITRGNRGFRRYRRNRPSNSGGSNDDD